ncbi:glycosyltransferase [Marinobacter sp. ANT_B65]|uniref:glycosyltransferase n=1 Tax=Marinobacter sp. ANT_B65 TaxID=2039467 RepID=UPI000BBF0176|nr:glycosyltransferase [Marinobacter sp. ANT_B65]PCM45252.1 mannosyltransferase [Marinobacter sp. ANT_B65]
MKLLIDLQCLQTSSRYRGIGHYVNSLVKALLTINKARPQPHNITLLFNGYHPELIDELRQQWGPLLEGVHIRIFHAPPDTAESGCPNQGIIRVGESLRDEFIARLEPDFVLIGSLFEGMTDNYVCEISRARQYAVGVIGYDLIPLISPEQYLGDPLIHEWYYHKLKSLHCADVIFAISESARKEFEDHLQQPDGSVITISTACDDSYYPLDGTSEDCSHTLAELGITRRYILYSGAADERKNLNALLQAFSQLDGALKNDLGLVLVGKFSEADRAGLSRFAGNHGIPPEHIIYTGFIAQKTLNVLYNRCSVFVFPSRHEGFGLPVLEAMTCGAPVLCANTTSLPEVMGLEAAMFGPDDIPRLASLITRVVTEPEFSKQLREHGLKQSKKFCWRKTAEKLLVHAEQIVSEYRPAGKADKPDRISHLARLCSIWQMEDHRLRQIANCLAANDLALEYRLPEHQRHWRIEGPFDSSYSLALLNREIARGLTAIGQTVSLHSTEGPGDFAPSEEFLADNPDVAQMVSRSQQNMLQPEITSRNLYPPRVHDMASDTRLLHLYAWEETGFPQEWVGNFNQHLTGLTCLSEHVQKVLIDNGVCLPMAVSGCGVDHWDRVEPQAYPLVAPGFRFLHVSSCFPRKGIDAMLQAWGIAFSRHQDVTLVIKTFDNPHNNVDQLLAEHQSANPDYPRVIVIKEDLPDGQLKSLYQQCHALIAPSKAEGFGLPLAEAMLSGLPVITTGWSGQMDFCDESTAWLVRFEFEPADTHFNLSDSLWANPGVEDLASQLQVVFNASESEREHKSIMAASRLREHFTWEQVAMRLANQTESIIKRRQHENLKRPLNIGWVSTFNQRCGLATYSQHLIEQNAEDKITVFAPYTSEPETETDNSPVVKRCWQLDDNDTLEDLARQLLAENLDAVVIQMNYYFYDYQALTHLIATLKNRGLVVTLTLHSTSDPEPRKAVANLQTALELADRVIVHTVKDINCLADIGIVSNAVLIPHGVARIEAGPVNWPFAGRPCIASYGFALPHKGLEELVDVFAQLRLEYPELVLMLLNSEHQEPVSGEFIESLHQRITTLGLEESVYAEHRFLPDAQSIGLLQQATVIAMPYQNTGESSSGAVKMAIASGRPVLVTPLPVFADVAPAVTMLKGTSAEALKEGLVQALAGKGLPDSGGVTRWRESRAYPVIAKRTFNMVRSLWINRQTGE